MSSVANSSLTPSEVVDQPQKFYEFQAFLGRGQNSRVLLARDPSVRYVAVKQMLSKKQLMREGVYSKEDLDSFFAADGTSLLAPAEFSIGQQLDHPHIAKIYDLFTIRAADGSLHSCLSMELVRGKTLDRIGHGSFTKKKTIEHVRQLIDALRHAFANQFLPNDLHFGNIMISKQGIKLVDLDSFDDLSSSECVDSEETRTNQQYLGDLFFVIEHVLRTGTFRELKISIIKKHMDNILTKRAYQASLQQPITAQSLCFFNSVLKDVAGALVRTTRVSRFAQRAGLHSHRLFDRLFCQ